jgi:hypothetical protein
VLVVGLTACTHREVNNYADWCAYIRSPNEDEQVDGFTFKRDSVIAGLVAAWDKILVENGAKTLGVPLDSIGTDTVVAEMRRIHMVGAWRQGDTLHLELTLIPPPITSRGRSNADVMADEYRKRMTAAAKLSAKQSMEPAMYCLYTGLNVFFARIDVRAGPGDSGRASIVSDVFAKLKAYNGAN